MNFMKSMSSFTFKTTHRNMKLNVFRVAANGLQLYLVADFENENFKFRTSEHRRTKLE